MRLNLCMNMPVNYFFYAALHSRFSCTYIHMYVCIYRRTWYSLLLIKFGILFIHKLFVITQLITVLNFSELFQAYVVDDELESFKIV